MTGDLDDKISYRAAGENVEEEEEATEHQANRSIKMETKKSSAFENATKDGEREGEDMKSSTIEQDMVFAFSMSQSESDAADVSAVGVDASEPEPDAVLRHDQLVFLETKRYTREEEMPGSPPSLLHPTSEDMVKDEHVRTVEKVEHGDDADTDANDSIEKSPSETSVESDVTEDSAAAESKKQNKKRVPVRFDFSHTEDNMEASRWNPALDESLENETTLTQLKSTPPSMIMPIATARKTRPTLQKSTTQTSHDLTRTIRTKTTLKLVDLIKAFYSRDASVVANCLAQLHALIDQQLSDEDNTLELGVVRRGGHLALLRALQRHLYAPTVQAMGFAALAWLCEHCNIKSILMDNGALPLVMNVLRYYSITNPQWSIVTEALYFVGHLSSLPKVAKQVRYRESASWQEIVPRLRLAYKDGHDDTAESAVDAFLFCSHQWAAHRSVDILQGVWQAGSLRFVVQLLQDALMCWQTAHDAGLNDACSAYEDRLTMGCRIVTHWAKTMGVVHVLIEAGALTVAAEILRLFPAGTRIRKAANPCLRAMVPATED